MVGLKRGQPATSVVNAQDNVGGCVDRHRVRPSHAASAPFGTCRQEGDARDRLLDRVIAFAAVDGISGRSLREIARGAGTSPRMLLYHFGSREGLLAAIVAAIAPRPRSGR